MNTHTRFRAVLSSNNTFIKMPGDLSLDAEKGVLFWHPLRLNLYLLPWIIVGVSSLSVLAILRFIAHPSTDWRILLTIAAIMSFMIAGLVNIIQLWSEKRAPVSLPVHFLQFDQENLAVITPGQFEMPGYMYRFQLANQDDFQKFVTIAAQIKASHEGIPPALSRLPKELSVALKITSSLMVLMGLIAIPAGILLSLAAKWETGLFLLVGGVVMVVQGIRYFRI